MKTTSAPSVVPSAQPQATHPLNRSFKPTLPAIALLACALSLAGCGQAYTTTPAPAPSTPPASAPAPTPQPGASQPQPVAQAPKEDVTDLEPEVGIIKRIQTGDLMCYITFTDEQGRARTVGATFELCEQPQQHLNQRRRLVYGVRNVNDCTSNEPCGKTRRTNLVIRLDPVESKDGGAGADTNVLRNGEWTITVGNSNSWSGVNGTGNLTYRGCNTKGECIDLSGGTITCRDGICATTWRNGSYTYTLSSQITEAPTNAPSTLTIAKNGQVIQRITNLK